MPLIKFEKDPRPRKGMWCPGEYLCKCHHCKKRFIGDKRSTTCADCAYEMSELVIMELSPAEAEMIRELREAKAFEIAEKLAECPTCNGDGQDPIRRKSKSHAACYGCGGCGDPFHCDSPRCPTCGGSGKKK
jgi:hypothetical protein